MVDYKHELKSCKTKRDYKKLCKKLFKTDKELQERVDTLTEMLTTIQDVLNPEDFRHLMSEVVARMFPEDPDFRWAVYTLYLSDDPNDVSDDFIDL